MATQQIKDILNTDPVRPSFVVRPSRVGPLPDDYTHSRGSAAWERDPVSVYYNKVSSGVQRIHTTSQSLLIEPEAQTNDLLNSGQASETTWGSYNTTWSDTDMNGNPVNKLFEGTNVDPHYVYGNGTTASNGQLRQSGGDAGTHVSGEEVVSAILEKQTADQVAVGMSFSDLIVYQFSTDSVISTHPNTKRYHAERITETGPNGKPLVRLSALTDSYASGNNRTYNLSYDVQDNDNGSIFHHGQVMPAPLCEPILTGSSTNTRAGEDAYVNFDNVDWRDVPGPFTLFMEFTITSHKNLGGFGEQILTVPAKWIARLTDSPPYNLGGNLNFSGIIEPFQRSRLVVSTNSISACNGVGDDKNGIDASINGNPRFEFFNQSNNVRMYLHNFWIAPEELDNVEQAVALTK